MGQLIEVTVMWMSYERLNCCGHSKSDKLQNAAYIWNITEGLLSLTEIKVTTKKGGGGGWVGWGRRLDPFS